MLRDKFSDPYITAKGETRASVALNGLDILWFNTGTLCNLTCQNCYIESSPKNDHLVYITLDEVKNYLDEIREQNLPTREIGITGGEPFMNPDIIPIMHLCLERGFKLLMLTNAMRPMMRHESALRDLKDAYHEQLTMRVSVDHFKQAMHEEERGPRSWEPMLKGLKWLSEHHFTLHAAGRTRWGEDETTLRAGFQALFEKENIAIDAQDQAQLILFPEMEEKPDIPEITTECWDILNVSPDDMMCAKSRMVVKRKGEGTPKVLACTLLAYDEAFEMGTTLTEASGDVQLNHRHCAKFCVLGGSSCG